MLASPRGTPTPSVAGGDVAYRELSVIEIREILRRWQRGHGYRKVAEDLGIDRKTVRRYVEAAQRHGLEREPATVEIDDELVGLVVAEVSPGRPPKVGTMRLLCRQHRKLIEGWRSDGCHTPKMVRLLKAYTDGVEIPERTLRRFIAEELGEEGRRGGTVRIIEPPPGEAVEIDFMELGQLLVEGEERKLHALVVVAAYSRHTFVWPCLTMTVDDLIEGLEATWTFFGGVFPIVIADNPKTIVTRADPLAPTFHEGFAQYAQSRGFLLDQARVRRPKDKPKVERTVRYVRSDGAAGERFLDLEDARTRMARWCREVAGMRVHGTTRRQPAVVFEDEERPQLLPVPEVPYDVPTWTSVSVGNDHAVCVAEALYSVPHRLRGSRLRVCTDRSTVKMYCRGTLVKVHARVPAGSKNIDGADLPPGLAELATRDAETLKSHAQRWGEHVGLYAHRVLEGALPWTRMRHAYRLLGLCKRFGGDRVDAACRKALDLDVVDVTRIARMLERDLVDQPVDTPAPAPDNVIRPRFGRSPEEFQSASQGESHDT